MTSQEILAAFVRRWKLIVFGAVFTAVVALGMSFALPPTYEAVSTVALAKATVSVQLGEKLRTMSEEEQLVLLRRSQDLQERRKALVALVKNAAIAQRVIEQLGDRLPEELRHPSKLIEQVEGKAQGDAIEIYVKAKDPELAATIANAWAREYERHINSIYGTTAGGESLANVQAETERARQDYLKAQGALEEFLAENRMNEINRQIEEKQAIITSLLDGKKKAVETIVSTELEVHSQLFTTLANAELKTVTTALSQQVEDIVQKLSIDYAVRRKLLQLVESARAMREQVKSSPAKASATSTLPLILLKAQAFALTADLPGKLEIALDAGDSLSTTPQKQMEDLDAVIAALEQQIRELDKSIEERSVVMLKNEGFQFLDLIGEVAGSSDAQARKSPLTLMATDVSRRLLQLQGLEDIPEYTAAAEPLTQAIIKLEDEVDALEAQLEAEQARKRELVRARDLAWEKYDTLATQVAEVDIASSITGTEVRFASPALVPTSPVSPKKKQNALLGLFVGLILAIGLVLVIEHPAVRGLMKAKEGEDGGAEPPEQRSDNATGRKEPRGE